MATTSVKAKPEIVEDEVEFGTLDPALAAILASLNAELAGPSSVDKVVHLKKGIHFIKLVLPPGRTIANFFESFDNNYQGKITKKYLINGVIVKSDLDGLEDKKKVRHIGATVTMVRGIVAQLAAQWPLFNDHAPVIKVRIFQDGDMTKYEVVTEQGKFNSAGCEYPETSIEDAAKDAQEYSMKKSETKDPLAFAVPAKESKAVDVDY